jgi:hypothetical protein
MGVERLELSRAYKAQRILSPQRLPFRHTPEVVFDSGLSPTVINLNTKKKKMQALFEKSF